MSPCSVCLQKFAMPDTSSTNSLFGTSQYLTNNINWALNIVLMSLKLIPKQIQLIYRHLMWAGCQCRAWLLSRWKTISSSNNFFHTVRKHQVTLADLEIEICSEEKLTFPYMWSYHQKMVRRMKEGTWTSNLGVTRGFYPAWNVEENAEEEEIQERISRGDKRRMWENRVEDDTDASGQGIKREVWWKSKHWKRGGNSVRWHRNEVGERRVKKYKKRTIQGGRF